MRVSKTTLFTGVQILTLIFAGFFSSSTLFIVSCLALSVSCFFTFDENFRDKKALTLVGYAFFLRLAFSYVTKNFFLQDDEVYFYQFALESFETKSVSQIIPSRSVLTFGWEHFIAILFRLISPDRINIIAVNSFLGILNVLLLGKIFSLYLPHHLSRKLTIAMLFLPFSVFLSSCILKSQCISVCVTAFFYAFLNYKFKLAKKFILIIISLYPIFLLRGTYVLFIVIALISYLILSTVLEYKDRKSPFNLKTVITISLIVCISSLTYLSITVPFKEQKGAILYYTLKTKIDVYFHKNYQEKSTSLWEYRMFKSKERPFISRYLDQDPLTLNNIFMLTARSLISPSPVRFIKEYKPNRFLESILISSWFMLAIPLLIVATISSNIMYSKLSSVVFFNWVVILATAMTEITVAPEFFRYRWSSFLLLFGLSIITFIRNRDQKKLKVTCLVWMLLTVSFNLFYLFF